jgi:two-component system LytT family response regulator
MKAIIVEDEELPRLTLLGKLADYHPDIQVVAQCEDVESAFREALNHHPDLLFLDIQLSGKDSLWLLEQLEKAAPLPCIIFTTAYDNPQYLLKAIRFEAIDYLLKPVDIVELSRAIKKAKERIAEKRDTSPQVFCFHACNSTLTVKAADILYVKADGNYSDMFLISGNREPIFERLGEIMKKLTDTPVVRVDKSHLINRMYIYKIEQKQKVCILQTPDTRQHKVELSANGIDEICRLLPRCGNSL